MRHWTPAEWQRQVELIWQWQPWQHSTGAKTIEGKAISSRNAYKGGVGLMMRKISNLLKNNTKTKISLVFICKRVLQPLKNNPPKTWIFCCYVYVDSWWWNIGAEGGYTRGRVQIVSQTFNITCTI